MSFVGVVLHCLNEDGGERHGRSINDLLATICPRQGRNQMINLTYSLLRPISVSFTYMKRLRWSMRVIEFYQDN